jgi:5S rRNA maturation endonuclease (ribonuclease M5)
MKGRKKTAGDNKMSKAPVDIIKYVIHAEAEANGLIEKPDLIGAIFGQTEGLLGEDLDLRELQKSGRIGRIDADMETKNGVTKAKVTMPSSLDMVETSIIAAGMETITRVGPCDAKFKILKIEDVREDKRKAVVDRAREILKTFMSSELPDSKEISEELRQDMRVDDITTLRGLDAGPAVESSEGIIIVEGRADVLNLLRNGIKNAIAVGGIKIPNEIVDITQNKNVSVFVDGDRGGDLILKSLRNAGVHIDSVSRAPVGREVEALSRKELIMSLRRKRSPEEAFAEIESATRDGKAREYGKPLASEGVIGGEAATPAGGSSGVDSGHREGEGDRGRDRGSRERGRDRGSRDRGSRERSGRDRGERSGRDRGERREPREERPPRAPRDEPVRTTEGDKMLETLSGIKNQAVLLDEKLQEMKKVNIDTLKKEKDLQKATALILDDVITNDILKLAENCKYIVGITTAGNLIVPPGKVIVTKF